MFEGIVATILNRFLGSYIENFDPKQLNIGIWSGDVKLRNLRLKKESLDKFRLPLDVKFGHLGELTLQIPWSNLKGKPVKIIIEDVYLLASPIVLLEYDLDEEKRRELLLKKERLNDLEAILAAQNQQLSSELNNESFTESLVTKIIDNLQVTIKNIHVRYEDDSVLTEEPYAVGLTLNELSAVSTDDGWVPSFISITQALSKKLLTLNRLSCYMSTDATSVFSEDHEQLLTALKESLEASDQYLLKPVSGEGRLSLHKKGATEHIPHIKAELFFDEFALDLDSRQYRDLLWTASKFHWYIKTQKFRKFRPKVPVSEDPREWFRYTARSVLNEIHERNEKWSWAYFAKRRDQRKAYVALWKDHLANVLTPEKTNELDALEEELPFEDIKFYRSLARSEYKVVPKPKQPENNQQKGWFSWWGSQPEAQPDEHDDLKLSDEQMKALYDTIDYNENNLSTDIDLPKDRVKVEVAATLKRGGVSIRPEPRADPLAEIVFEGCTAQLYERPTSLLANFQLEEFRVEDGTQTTLYKHIVLVKQLHHHDETVAPTNEPFFKVSFENNPLDGQADSALTAKLNSMNIYYNPHFIEQVYQFFRPPKIHLDTVGAIMNAAEATVEGITSQTRIGLQYALEEHKTINVKLDLQAPLIIVPLDPKTWKSPVAILDAGHISVVSDLVDKLTLQEIKDKNTYSADDWDRLNTLMYDRFNLHLQDAQFLVGPTIKETMEQLHSRDKQPSLILDRLDIKLLFGVSILPDAVNLARFKIGAEVPEIKLALNDFQYKTIMQIIDVAIPDFDDLDSDEESVFNALGHSHKPPLIDLDTSDVAQNKPVTTQHLFDFDFKVSVVQLSLSRCIDGVTLEAEPLVDLVGDSLLLSLYRAGADMHLDLTLKDINMIDHLELSGVEEFHHLISSSSHKKHELFRLAYDRTQRIVDFNGKEIEVFDQDIDLDIATVKFVVTRKSLLSLLNFVLNTFTDPNAEATPADELKHNNADDDASPQKINVNVNLESIIMVLNEEGVKLATLQLSTANIEVFVVPEELEVKGLLGALTLHDELNTGLPRDSILRNLISIKGENLAKFRYKTFDVHTNTLPYDSLVEFSTGSSTINFVEDAFGKIFAYLSQFQRMKAIYDSARDAAINQAAQIDPPGKMKFDFLLKAPTIVFPRVIGTQYDTITVELGQLYASNDLSDGNVITAGLRNASLASEIHFDDVTQACRIVDDLDIGFHIDYVEHYDPAKPTFTVDGKMPEVDIRVSEHQVNFLLQLLEAVTNVFAVSDDVPELEEIELDAENANAVAKHNNAGKAAAPATQPEVEIPPEHPQVKLQFVVPRLSLSIYNGTDKLSDIRSKKLGRFSLNEFNIAFDMRQDSHFVSDVTIKSFTVTDIREGTHNKFPEIIIPVKDTNQFVLNATTEGEPDNKNTTVMLAVELPKTILALDYLFELQDFANKATRTEKPIIEEEEDDDDATVNEEAAPGSDPRLGFSVNISNPTVMLLADPTREDTEAVVFRVEQVLLTSQNVISLAANNIGMFLSQMPEAESKLRIIDDFSISFAHDLRGLSQNKFLTNIQLSVEPLLVRVSLRDIRLAMLIFNKANELYNAAQVTSEKVEDFSFSDDFKRRLSHYAPTIRSTFSTEVKPEKNTEVIVKAEEFHASIGGARFVLIGDVHELPVLDMNVKPFEAQAINWLTDLSAETHIESYVNIYNYSRSTWEPLIEPWPIAVYASKETGPLPKVIVDLVSRELAQVTVSSRSIVLLLQVFSSISDPVLKSREETTPYRIVNETGYDIDVWIDVEEKKQKTQIANGSTIGWSFEDWRQIRENLDTDGKSDVLGLQLVDSPYEAVSRVLATAEGEEIFMLQPPVDGVHNRLSIEITLGDDNVKTILVKSTVSVKNVADIPIQVKINTGEMVEVGPHETHALPIDRVYGGKFAIRPEVSSDYAWSNSIVWHDLLEGGLTLSCKATGDNDTSVFNFQAEAKYDKTEPLGKIYPHMTLVVSSPVEVENLLPFDLNYRLYDKSSKKDWSGSIEKGSKTHVHVVSLQSLLLLSVEIAGYAKGEFAIINTPRKSEFRREKVLTLRGKHGHLLKLHVHYPRNHNGLKVVVYAPYVVLNRTGQNVVVSERNNALPLAAKSQVPGLFSFNKEDRQNRATLQIGDSVWSGPVSFEAIGLSNAVKAQVNGKQAEMNVAVSISEGEGKYKLSKVVTVAPRYILKNNLMEDMEVVENGSTRVFSLASQQLLPLFNLRRTEKKSLLLRFARSKWSAPFAIEDIGQIFLKVQKEGVGQVLLKVNILVENGTIFIQADNANNKWPFSIRNFSDTDFYIYQLNPNVNDNGDVVKDDVVYKPIYYRVPPKSVMPYAYDYPNAVIKELVIRSHGRERLINLAEIGNLKPFRLPATDTEEQAIVDLNVIADGPTQSLVISNYDPGVSLYKLNSNRLSSTAVDKFEAAEDENYHTRVVTRFEGFGISLINARGQELCYMTLRGLEVRYNESDLYQNLSVKLKWIQVDNQLYGGIFPIVIYPSVVPKSGKEMNNHPSFSASVCKVKDDLHGVLFIKYATVLLQEMTVEIDEDFLFALLDFAKLPGASWNREYVDRLCDDLLQLPEPEKLAESSDIYFEALHLQPAMAHLSFVRTEKVNVEDRQLSQNALMFFFNVLTMAIGNINDAPIKLNALFIENIRVPIPVLMESIQTHYGQDFFYQVHKILGSADFIGNPVGLFNNLSSGVLDIFYEPYQGFVINDRPQELGIGIAKGGLSFLKKSIFGFSDSFSKMTGSIAKGLSVVTLDKKFQERRRLNQRRNKPKHALYGFSSGANSFFESFSSGITGIATNPIEGASTEGAAGFFKGLGKGVVGLPTKTAIGFFDLASNVSEGIRNTTTVFDAEGLDKVRLPRYISHDQVIRPYSQREAQGQFWLKSLDGGELFNETYLAHLVLSGEENAVIVTFRRIMLLEINNIKTKWRISFDQIRTISLEPTGISIVLKKREGPFLPIPEKQNRVFLYNKISIAVQEFNKHCQVQL